MQKSEILDRVESDKERNEFKEDHNKPNKLKMIKDRRRVKCRRAVEDMLEERRLKQDEGYE